MGKILADRIDAVVAVNAIATNTNVIKVRWQPADGRVTVVTGLAAGDVGRVLTGCCHAIVTRAT